LKKNVTIFLLFNLVTGICLFGQHGYTVPEPIKLTFYYDLNWELTTPEKSSIRREAYFDLQEMVFDGVYQDYNKANKLIAEGYYAHGRKSGIQTEHFEDQSIRSTIEFSDDDFIIWQLVNDKREYEIAKGTGKFSIPFYYFFDYYLKQGILHGEFKNGKRVGAWIYYDTKKQKTDIEHYQNNGNLWSHTRFTNSDSVILDTKKEIILSVNSIYTESLAFDKESYSSVNQYFERQITFPNTFQRNVSYPGGLKRLLRLLMEAGVPERNLVLVKVKIDEHGQVMKTGIVRSVDLSTDDRVLKVFELHQARLVPAIKDGKPYSTTIYLPVSGGERWEKMLQEMPTEWFLDMNNFY